MSLLLPQLFTPATQPQWLATLLQNAQILGLNVTQWQSGGVAQTILQIISYVLQTEDVQISIIAQGGFLDFAASGSITYTDVNGVTQTVYVTPDPSNPAQNPTGQLGWLDALADSVYDVQRISFSLAGGNLAIINSSGNTYGPFAPGTYHVADSLTPKIPTYHNTASLTIAPTPLVVNISNVTPHSGQIEITTSSAHGLSTGDVIMIVGVQGIPPLATPTVWTITVVSSNQFLLQGSNFGGLYVSGGSIYIPFLAPFQADVGGSAGNSLDASGVPDVNTVIQPVTSLVGVSVANPVPYVGTDIESNTALAARCRLKLQSISQSGSKGAYAYYALMSQQFAPKITNPSTGLPYNVSTAITRVLVMAGFGQVFVSLANAFGVVSSSDVAAVQAVETAYATPLGVISSVVSASAQNIKIVANIWVPTALNNDVTRAIFQTAIQTFISSFPIGGVSDPNGSYTNILPIDAVIGACYTAGQLNGITIQDVVLVDGGVGGITQDVSLTSGGGYLVAVLTQAVPTVNLISV